MVIHSFSWVCSQLCHWRNAQRRYIVAIFQNDGFQNAKARVFLRFGRAGAFPVGGLRSSGRLALNISKLGTARWRIEQNAQGRLGVSCWIPKPAWL